MQSANNSQRTNYLQNSQQSSRRARIFDQQHSSGHRSPPSILPISNSQIQKSPIQTEDFNVQGLESSQVSEVQINDLNRVNQFSKIPDLSRCKVKFIKKENQSTQTESDERDEIIRQQEMLIKQLQEKLNIQNTLEFSFHKENTPTHQSMTNSPYKKQTQTFQQQHYFTVVPSSNHKSFILKPQNTEKLVQEYSKQKTNKEYFFSQMD